MDSLFPRQFMHFRNPDPDEKKYIAQFCAPHINKMFWIKTLQKILCYFVGFFLVTVSICGSFIIMDGNTSWGLLAAFPIILLTDHVLSNMSFDIIRSRMIYHQVKNEEYVMTESGLNDQMITAPHSKICDVFVFQEQEPIFVMTIVIPKNEDVEE